MTTETIEKIKVGVLAIKEENKALKQEVKDLQAKLDEIIQLFSDPQIDEMPIEPIEEPTVETLIEQIDANVY